MAKAASKPAPKKPAAKKPVAEAKPEKGAAKPLVKLPASLGACADLYAELKDTRLEEGKKVTELEKKEKFVKNFLTEKLSKGSDRGAVGRHHRVHVDVENVPQVDNWDDFYAYIKKTGQFHLLNKAINTAAIQELWDDNKVVPGVVAVPVCKLRLHKI